jgi:D-beta-D-heptose 7-phosphate kinase/D-beta-D-heptose 1-phosphate adenosyltransferase
MAQHQQLIRIDFEETPLQFNKVRLAEKLKMLIHTRDVIVFSDYGKGTLVDIASYIALAQKAGLKHSLIQKGTIMQNTLTAM